MNETNPRKQDTQNEDEDEDVDITCNSSCNIHYHIRKHAKSVIDWLKSIFKKLLLFI